MPAVSIRARTLIKRPLQLGVQRPEPFALAPWPPGSPRSARSRRRPRRHTRRPGRRRPGPSSDWFFPLPIKSVIGIIVVVEQPLGELIEVVVALAAFEQIAQDHRVGERARRDRRRPAECQQVVLDILADLLDGRIGQDRAQGDRGSPLLEQRWPRRARAAAGTTPLRPSRKTTGHQPARRGSIAVVSVSTQNRGWRGAPPGSWPMLRVYQPYDSGLPGLPGRRRRASAVLPSSSRNRWKPHSMQSAFKASTSGAGS